MGLTSRKKLTTQVTPRVNGNRKLANVKKLFKLAISEQQKRITRTAKAYNANSKSV